MTTDDGGWTLLLDQDVALGHLPSTTWSGGVTATAAIGGQYSILQEIAHFESESGFEFLLDWDDRSRFVQWNQSTNPYEGRGDVTNLVQNPGSQIGCTEFSGLGDPNTNAAALDGSSDGWWWWAVGTAESFGGGIPAYETSTEGPYVAQRTRLWVRN